MGAALLRGEWQSAVQLIMQGGEGERQEFREARALYTEKGDVQVRSAAVKSTYMATDREALCNTLWAAPYTGDTL